MRGVTNTTGDAKMTIEFKNATVHIFAGDLDVEFKDGTFSTTGYEGFEVKPDPKTLARLRNTNYTNPQQVADLTEITLI